MPDAKHEQQSPTFDVKLTRPAEDVLERAFLIAAARGAQRTDADAIDVLEALLQTRGTLADRAIRSLGADPAKLSKTLPPREGSHALPLKQLLANSFREAQVLGHYQVDSIHLLLAMLYSDSPQTSGPLQKAGLTLYDLRRHLQAGTKVDFQPGESDRVSGNRPQQPGRRTQPPAAPPRPP